ncbi:MAG TPA: peptide chain release factor N(5)-glutamine methyltransferase [Rhizomicrobium sp.]|nr:peptide chain release factor N(5)-glutamine methyltransferase [Rhizomicrobium sp.]
MSDVVADAAQRLRQAGVGNPRLDARLLWAFAQKSLALFESLVARRAAREPLAYIVGHKEFWSLDFAVGPGVLIPRPDSETLIGELRRTFADHTAPLAILDLGTGSGALLVAALGEYPNAHGVGIDLSPEALGWARRNVAAHRLEHRATLIESGWLEEASPGFDAVLCNPPYIATADIAGLEPEVARHEPLSALDGGPDGLAAYRALAPRIGRLLKPAGRAILELGAGQAEAVAALLGAEGLQIERIAADLAGIPRSIAVRRPPAGT